MQQNDPKQNAMNRMALDRIYFSKMIFLTIAQLIMILNKLTHLRMTLNRITLS